MLRRIRSRLTFANTIAMIALFISLGGVAGAQLGLITGAQVADESLTDADILNGSLNPAIGAGAINSAKVADDSLTGADVLESSLGQVPDAANADKLDGLDATAFVRDLSRHTGASDTNTDSGKSAVARCPAGKAAISGGGHVVVSQQSSLPSPLELTFVAIDNIQVSSPGQIPGNVIVSAKEIHDTGSLTLDEDWTVFAHAICARIN
jgi:hypothetical protein